MVLYKITTDTKEIEFQKSFADKLSKNNIPTIYLGDIKESDRYRYFCKNIIDFNKETYFNIGIGKDIVDTLVNKYKNGKLKNKQWTEGNGIIFLYYKGMIIVMNYSSIEDDEIIGIQR